jgi:hypothetical protein
VAVAVAHIKTLQRKLVDLVEVQQDITLHRPTLVLLARQVRATTEVMGSMGLLVVEVAQVPLAQTVWVELAAMVVLDCLLISLERLSLMLVVVEALQTQLLDLAAAVAVETERLVAPRLHNLALPIVAVAVAVFVILQTEVTSCLVLVVAVS